MGKKILNKDKNLSDKIEIESEPKDAIRIGTPPAVLFPPRTYKFRVVEDNITININRSGKYTDLAPEFFDEKDGSFNIFDEDKKVIYVPSITKVLFAEHKYPDMKVNQLFVLLGIRVKDKSVDVMGQIIEVLNV